MGNPHPFPSIDASDRSLHGVTDSRDGRPGALENERRFRLLAENATDYALYMLDSDGLVVDWNIGAQRVMGYTDAEIRGRSSDVFFPPEDVAAGRPGQALGMARSHGRYAADGWRLRKDGGRFWAHVVTHAFHGGGLAGYAEVVRDLTERQEAQSLLEQVREQLFQSQKMEAVGQLTGGLAHDFGNLLTGISGSLALMKLRVAQGRLTEFDRYIDAAQDSAGRAAALTHRMLAFARRQTLDPRPTNPSRLIGDMGDLVRRAVGPDITVRTTLSAASWDTLCDPNQLENVLLNLCINARDAMQGGGEIVIAVADLRLEAPGPGWDLSPGEYVSISIADTGTGMAPEIAARAFEPFFTTKPLGLGTGLGLSMTQGFARQSGGQVRIHSELGRGTTVRLLLPRHHRDPAEGFVPPGPAEALPEAGLRAE